MEHRFTRWLSFLMMVCMLLSLAPAALMEEIPAPEEEIDEAIMADFAEEAVGEEEIYLEEGDPEEIEMELDDSYEDLMPEPDDAGEEIASVLYAAATSGVAIDAAHFPDEQFRTYINYVVDADKDGVLSDLEIQQMDEIEGFLFDNGDDVVNFHPNSLQGIEYLSSLNYFSIEDESIPLIDLSKNAKLSSIRIVSCGLTTLKLGSHPELRILELYGNNLSGTLDVSCYTNLEDLQVTYNSLTALKLGKLPKLSTLFTIENKLTSLDISGCPVLLTTINKVTPTTDDAGYIEYHYENFDSDNNIDYWLVYDKTTSLVTVATTPTPTPKPTPTPTPKPTSAPKSAPTPMPVIKVAKKNVKATVNVGTQYKIDLNGATANSFKSSKKKVAKVDSNGVLTPKAKGKAKITIKIGKKKRTLTLTVKDPTIPTKVTLNMAGTVAAKKGTSVTLKATLPAGTNSRIKWKSSNKKVATVNNGVVTFKKKGKVTIVATAVRGKKKAKVKFIVSD